MRHGKRVAVVMPAYNAEKTLIRSFDEVPKEWVDDVILVDDASRDGTVALARTIEGLKVVVHPENRGYGGNQKTCYATALGNGADIVVMVHPDHQYDASVLHDLIEPIAEGKVDAMFGSRMLGGRPIEGGMPKWKYLANVFLTAVENATFYLYLTEYHSGLRAYSRRYLETVNLFVSISAFVLGAGFLLFAINMVHGAIKGPKVEAKKVGVIGICTDPPSARPANTRRAAASSTSPPAPAS